MEITKEAYSEVYAILNLMSWNSISKIPEKIWENIDNKRDKDKIIEINNIEDYQASEQANKLLAVLYRDYFATDEKKLIVIEEYISGRTLDNIIRKDGIFHEEKAQDTILIGTEGFAAPEQYGFRQSDPRTDIYAVGVLLNYMLTGKNQVEKLAEGRFQNMILKCTKLAPEARYQSVDDILHGINHLFSYGGNSNYQSVKEKVTYTSSIKSENLRSGFMNMVENVMRFIRWTNQMENSSNKSLNQESKPSWRRFLPPGFRSGQPWKMALAVIGYISIIYFR